MIDKALGFDAPVGRRKRPDTNSEASSNKEPVGNSSSSSPIKPAVKKLYKEEPAKTEESGDLDQEATSISNFSKPKGGRQSKPEKGTESEEEISSPAVKNLKVARVPLSKEGMKSSTKLYLQESAKHMESSTHIESKQGNDDIAYKIKILVFLIISVLLTLNAMTPDRKVSYRRK